MTKKAAKLKNDRHERFCQEYVIDLNATRAYRKVYKCSKDNARKAGSRLLKKEDVAKRVKCLLSKANTKTELTAKKVLEAYEEIAFAPKKARVSAKDRLRALDSLGKHLGIFEKDNEQGRPMAPQIIVFGTPAKSDDDTN